MVWGGRGGEGYLEVGEGLVGGVALPLEGPGVLEHRHPDLGGRGRHRGGTRGEGG